MAPVTFDRGCYRCNGQPLHLYSAPMSCELRCRPAWSPDWLELGRHGLAPMEVRPLAVPEDTR